MKLYTAILSASLMVGLSVRCKDNNATPKKPDKITSDTIPCIAIYKDGFDGNVKYGDMLRVVRDSFMWVDRSPTERVMEWGKDTTYLIVHLMGVDSNISKKYNVPILDSTGKQNKIAIQYPYHKSMIRNGWDRADSAINQLRK